MPYAPPPPPQQQQQYEVVPQGSAVRWNFWLSDGPADIYPSNRSLGNRFRLGGDANLLRDYRLILGVTMLDLLTSGESSTDVGGVSRYGFDLHVGYFLIPDSLYIQDGLYLGEVRGSNIFGWVGTIGNSLTLGWRFMNEKHYDIAIEAGYLFIGSETAGTFDPFSGATGTASYPPANVYSISLRVGFNLGGGP